MSEPAIKYRLIKKEKHFLASDIIYRIPKLVLNIGKLKIKNYMNNR